MAGEEEEAVADVAVVDIPTQGKGSAVFGMWDDGIL